MNTPVSLAAGGGPSHTGGATGIAGPSVKTAASVADAPVPGPGLNRPSSGHRKGLSARGGPEDARQPHRRAARHREPAHRHLVGDGRRGPAAVPRLYARLHAAPVRRRRRRLPGRHGARAARRAASSATAGSRHKEVAAIGYGLSALCKLGLVAGRQRLGRDRRDHAARPHRQGHPHRAARRADLAEQPAGARSALSFGVHRALDTDGRDARPAAWRSGCSSIAPLAFDSIFLVSFCIAVRRRGGPACCSSTDARSGPTPARARAPRRRSADAGRCSAAPGFRALVVIGGRAGPRDAQRRLHLPRARARARLRADASSRCCSWAPPRVYMVLAVPDGPARGPDRPRPRVRRRATRCCSRVYLLLLMPWRGLVGDPARRSACSGPTTRPPTAC